MTDRRYLQMEYIWVSGRFSRGDRRPDMVAEQALDMGVHIVCSRVYISAVPSWQIMNVLISRFVILGCFPSRKFVPASLHLMCS